MVCRLPLALIAAFVLAGCGEPSPVEPPGWRGLEFATGDLWRFTAEGSTPVDYRIEAPAVLPYFSGDLRAFQFNQTNGQRTFGVDFHGDSGLPLGLRQKASGEFWSGGTGGYLSHEFQDLAVLPPYLPVAFSGMAVTAPVQFAWANAPYVARPLDGALRVEPLGVRDNGIEIGRVKFYDLRIDDGAQKVDVWFQGRQVIGSLQLLEGSGQPPLSFDLAKTPPGHGLPVLAAEDWQHRFLAEPFTGDWTFTQALALDRAEAAQGWPGYGRYVVRSAHWQMDRESVLPIAGGVTADRNESWSFKVQKAGSREGVEFNVTMTMRAGDLLPMHEVSAFRNVAFADSCEGQAPQPSSGAVPLALQMQKAGFHIRFANADLVHRSTFVDPVNANPVQPEPVLHDGKPLPLPCDWRLQVLGENRALYERFPPPPQIPVLDLDGWQTGDGFSATV